MGIRSGFGIHIHIHTLRVLEIVEMDSSVCRRLL
jgi:hypothetical protein